MYSAQFTYTHTKTQGKCFRFAWFRFGSIWSWNLNRSLFFRGICHSELPMLIQPRQWQNKKKIAKKRKKNGKRQWYISNCWKFGIRDGDHDFSLRWQNVKLSMAIFYLGWYLSIWVRDATFFKKKSGLLIGHAQQYLGYGISFSLSVDFSWKRLASFYTV